MALTLLVLASTAYSVGGVFMKLSDGLSRGGVTAVFVALFAGGSLMQGRAMKGTDLGVTYIVVLGIEALITVLLSVLYLREPFSWSRMAAIVTVVVGIAWLRVT